MSDTNRFRWPTIITAAVALTLAAFTLWWTFEIYADQRAPDFTLASAGTIPGTCVEAVTDDQLKILNFDDADWSCKTSSKEQLSDLLAVNVHAMYAANAASAYTGDAKAAYDAVISAVQGADPTYTISRAEAYAALSTVGTPSSVDCAVIYGTTTEGTLTTPLAPTVACDADLPTTNTFSGSAADTAILYTHCVNQFSYARSWPTSKTLGIPKVGEEAKPVLFPLVAVNSTTPWEHRQRILVGTRFGYSSIVYILFMLTTAFFLMDCTILLLAELTRVDAYFAQNALVEGNSKSMREGMMTMLSTFQAKRNLRWAIAIICIILELVLWSVLIGLPWGFGFDFARPICETGDADHWLNPWWESTKGGWKKDYDAFALEILIVVSHLFIAIAVPISEMSKRSTGNTGRRDRTGQGDLEGFTGVAVGSLRSAWWFAAIVVGGLIFYVGQAVAGFLFGVAWAEGVSDGKHNEVAVGTMIYDHINAILYMSLTVGLTLGSIVGRWLLAGLSCTSFTIFLVWVLLTIGAFIPPFFVSTYWVFFDFEDSQGQEDCKGVFGDSDDYVVARSACDARAATYIIGIILLLVAALGPIIIGLFDYSRVLCLPRRRAWVDMPDFWRQLIEPANSKFKTFAPAPGPDGVHAIQPLLMQPVGTGAKSDFFKFETRFSQAGDAA